MIQNGTWDKDLSDDLRNSLAHEATQGIRAAEIEKNRKNNWMMMKRMQKGKRLKLILEKSG